VLLADVAATPAAKDRFAREAARRRRWPIHRGRSARLRRARGRPYAVSELIAGSTLRARLRAPGPPRRAAEWAAQAACGLAAAHAAGIVHRDVKPENLVLSRDGRVKVLDFGLARQQPGTSGQHVAAGDHMTAPGVILGTVGYMAPEQVRGRSSTIARTSRAGPVLHELVVASAVPAATPGDHGGDPARRSTPGGGGAGKVLEAVCRGAGGGRRRRRSPPGPVPPASSASRALPEKNPPSASERADLAFALSGLSGESSVRCWHSPARRWPPCRRHGAGAARSCRRCRPARRLPSAAGSACEGAASRRHRASCGHRLRRDPGSRPARRRAAGRLRATVARVWLRQMTGGRGVDRRRRHLPRLPDGG
jgi:hypothetical protein